MTAPVPHGYPDWQRQSSANDVVYVNTIGITITVPVATPIFYVGNFPALGLYFVSHGGWFRVLVTYYADQAGTVPLSKQDFVVPAAGNFNKVVAALGPWCKVQIIPGTGVTWTYDLIAWGAQAPSQPLIAANAVQIFSPAIVIPATTTNLTTAPLMLSGSASISWQVGAASFEIAVLQLDENAVGVNSFRTINPGPAIGSGQFAVGTGPLRLSMTNNDANPHSFAVQLTIAPSSDF